MSFRSELVNMLVPQIVRVFDDNKRSVAGAAAKSALKVIYHSNVYDKFFERNSISYFG